MHSSRVDEANSISLKIGGMITRYNSTKLSNLDPSTNSKDLWDEVCRLTKGSGSSSSAPLFDSNTLNSHYAAISRDPNYQVPTKKSPGPAAPLVSEYQVFNLYG